MAEEPTRRAAFDRRPARFAKKNDRREAFWCGRRRRACVRRAELAANRLIWRFSGGAPMFLVWFGGRQVRHEMFVAARFEGCHAAALGNLRGNLRKRSRERSCRRGDLGQVRFARLLPARGEQLIFAESANYGGSGLPGELVVIDFNGGADQPARRQDDRCQSRVLDTWSTHSACAARSYRFTSGRTSGRYLGERFDQRPWLGVYLRAVTILDPSSPVLAGLRGQSGGCTAKTTRSTRCGPPAPHRR